jgi:hypothetical protein
VSDPDDHLGVSLLAFYEEHRRCGDLDSDVAEVTPGRWRVWIECRGCGADRSRGMTVSAVAELGRRAFLLGGAGVILASPAVAAA